MSKDKKKIRSNFREAVFTRDDYKCRVCSFQPSMGNKQFITERYDCVLDAHHITDRNLMPNGGYVLENGISLCPDCHEKAEVYHSTGEALDGFSPQELYVLIGSSYDEAYKASEKLKL